jgi:hypothetical protein
MTFFLRFSFIYFTSYANQIGELFFESFGEAIESAVASADLGDTIFVTDRVNMPYIGVLFRTQTPPREYLDTVRIPNPNSPFQGVTSFTRFRFGLQTPAARTASVIVADNHELSRFNLSEYLVVPFRYYSTLFRKTDFLRDSNGTIVKKAEELAR